MIRLFKVRMDPDAPAAVRDVLESGYIGQGPKVDEFERQLSEFMGSPILTVNSGTTALELALHLIGVGPGDEVISTPQTCSATNSAIAHCGATIVWADIDPLTGNISPASVGRAISTRTKAIMAVDWAGQACQYDELRSFGFPVIEDAAHAVGTHFAGSHVAETGGTYSCYSFQAIKHLTTGDGGAIRVPEDQLDRARRIRWFGLDRRESAAFRCRQDISEIGFKYHMNDIAAAIGIANLRSLSGIVARHTEHATYLADQLRLVSNVEVAPSASLKWSSNWFLTVLVSDPDSFVRKMEDQDVEVSPVHIRNDRYTAFRAVSRAPVPLTGVDHFASKQVGIPCGWWLNRIELDAIVEAVKACA
jgi:dTDP-4-amino-4,6-dideoxy-D-glucose/dTDP-4-amino-2,4-dideoxy-beta-L-xylose transaminase